MHPDDKSSGTAISTSQNIGAILANKNCDTLPFAYFSVSLYQFSYPEHTTKKIVFLLLSFLLTSCGVLLNSSTDSDISSDRTYLSVEIIQTLSKTEALAWTRNYKVVKIETDSEIFYDGKEVAGEYMLTGTYTYPNKEGTFRATSV